MKKLLIVLLVLVVAAGGVGYWRGWFDFKEPETNDGKTNVTGNKDEVKAPVTRGESQAVSPAVVQFLLTSTATDFHAHRPPDPVRFRDVRVGYVVTPGGEKQYRLCGQFLPASLVVRGRNVEARNRRGNPCRSLSPSRRGG